jgi:hypothetical protein
MKYSVSRRFSLYRTILNSAGVRFPEAILLNGLSEDDMWSGNECILTIVLPYISKYPNPYHSNISPPGTIGGK